MNLSASSREVSFKGKTNFIAAPLGGISDSLQQAEGNYTQYISQRLKVIRIIPVICEICGLMRDADAYPA